MMPLNAVSNVGFQRCSTPLNHDTCCQTEKQSHTTTCQKCTYRQVKIKITEAMKRGLLYFSLTTGAWTSRASSSYVTHTVHYIDEKWNLCSNVLDTAEITTEHTAVHLSGELKESLAK